MNGPDRNSMSDLHKEWFRLRRCIEDVQDSYDNFLRYAHHESASECLGDSFFKKIGCEHDVIKLEARRLEVEMKDYLQFQTGNASLEESKRSIELSNMQILEAKRGNFVYFIIET